MQPAVPRCLRTSTSHLLLVVLSFLFPLRGYTRLVFVAPTQSGGNLRPLKPQLPLDLYTLVRRDATNRSGNVYSALLPVVAKDFWISLPAAIWKSTIHPLSKLSWTLRGTVGPCCLLLWSFNLSPFLVDWVLLDAKEREREGVGEGGIKGFGYFNFLLPKHFTQVDPTFSVNLYLRK